jgi:kynurenine formamidase
MANTHIDALCHVFWQNKMYNGFDATEVGSQGAKRCAIDVTRAGIVSRGVLLDIPRLKKIEWMEPREKILPEDLDAAEKAQNVHVEEGDVLLVRTGRAAMRKVKGGWDPMRVGLPGLDAVSAACAGLDRNEFMFSMAPLILERGTASPVNPLAIF